MPVTDLSIHAATTAEDLKAVADLFRAYVDWLDIDLAYQGFEAELAGLPGKYAPPKGALLLARDGEGRPLGCVGLRPFGPDDCCEMKRLYVAPEGRGQGLGDRLVQAVLEAARAAGYTEMLLDTLPSMAGAIALYRKYGFVPTERYYDTPIAETLFFKCHL